jgi:hypothetical protein
MHDNRPTEPPEFDTPDECPTCKRVNHDPESGDPVCESHAPFCCEGCERKYHEGQYAVVKVDGGASYIGDDRDGGYYQSAEGPDGWYVSNIIDSDTGGFVDNYITDDGPYPTETEANEAGANGLRDWCLENDVRYEKPLHTLGENGSKDD